MEIPIYQVDAFADEVFRGNPAAVCPLINWIHTDLMQLIASENNLSETAFFVPNQENRGTYELRWFTPLMEVDLCGHATLASAYVIFEFLAPNQECIRFETRSGLIEVVRRDELFFMDLPAYTGLEVKCPNDLLIGLGAAPKEVIEGPNYIAVFDAEQDVRDSEPDLERLSQLHPRGVIVTAPGIQHDFVSRFFGPSFGVPEDPVTGSAHCMLVPFWSKKFDKRNLKGRQISTRGGELICEMRGNRVRVGGNAVLYLRGLIQV
ncbi:MAG: PhzF family phenazine biosynthesis protein [Pseudomonadota bacterium]|nr:PhzF family phenazine biosynthesis protein [Pseudomonadota bacterium]